MCPPRLLAAARATSLSPSVPAHLSFLLSTCRSARSCPAVSPIAFPSAAAAPGKHSAGPFLAPLSSTACSSRLLPKTNHGLLTKLHHLLRHDLAPVALPFPASTRLAVSTQRQTRLLLPVTNRTCTWHPSLPCLLGLPTPKCMDTHHPRTAESFAIGPLILLLPTPWLMPTSFYFVESTRRAND